MKRLLALTVVLFGSIGLTQIAFGGPEPLPSGKEMREVAPAPPPCNWTGFYIGVQGSWTGGTLEWKDVDFGDNEILIHHHTDGFFGGGTLGYNHQFGSWLVVGAEGDFSWSSDRGGHRRNTTFDGEEEEITTWDTENGNWIGTFGLRVGVTSFDNRLLAYVKGGAAIEEWNYHEKSIEFATVDFNGINLENEFRTDETRVVPMLAFGLEYAINCHWSIKAEYKHLFASTKTITGRATDPVGNNLNATEPESYDVEINQDSVQAGLNFKFW